MEITVTAPNRVDLAGGTTDIHPLYLLMGGGCTANVAVTIASTVTLRIRDSSGVRIASEDLAEAIEVSDVSELPIDGPLGLLGRAVRALPPYDPVEIVTRNNAPAGSGLGASSALLVAVIAGLLELRGETESHRAIVNLAANIETAAIAVPAGKQDHIAAVYGGVSLIEFGYDDFTRHSLPKGETGPHPLEEMLILSYTGQGRFSGMNNWEITREFIDGNEDVREKLRGIRDVAREVCRSMEQGNWDALPALVGEEWRIRRTLAPGVSTTGIEKMMAAATAAGALASKVCGAGGGGCMITLTPPRKREAVENALRGAGAELLPVKVDWNGLVLRKQP